MQKSNLLQQTPDNGDDCFQHQGADQGDAVEQPAKFAAHAPEAALKGDDSQRLGQQIQYKPEAVGKEKAPL